jgi:hypothetical protein
MQIPLCLLLKTYLLRRLHSAHCSRPFSLKDYALHTAITLCLFYCRLRSACFLADYVLPALSQITLYLSLKQATAEIKDKKEKNHKLAQFSRNSKQMNIISGPLKARVPFMVRRSWDIVLEHALKPAQAPNMDEDSDPSALRLVANISKWEDLYAQCSSILIKLLLAKTSHSILPLSILQIQVSNIKCADLETASHSLRKNESTPITIISIALFISSLPPSSQYTTDV